MPQSLSTRASLALLPLLLTSMAPAGASPQLPSTLPAATHAPSLLTPTGPEPLLLMTTPGAARVVWGESGWQQDLPVPRGGVLTRFEAMGSEWVAAGTVARDSGRELLLLTSFQGTVERLPPPPERRGALRHDPVPLVSGGRLVGLAWLQGQTLDRLGVWAASWDGVRWQGLQKLAPPGSGSQLALAGAVLDDRSWLLAWSRFQGSADQIYWSLRRQDSWTPPQPVDQDNNVPDIRPALVATGDGALLAWSRWDGESYRLMLSGWGGASWAAPETVGDRGSLYPVWRRGDEGARLLYRQASTGSWELLETDPAGRVVKRASVVGSPEHRPVLASPAGTALLFPDGRSEALPWSGVLQP